MDEEMRLTLPTDLEILEALSDGKRNTAANLAHILDKDRAYLNTRLPMLADSRLVERVGPAPRSGLYEITEKGKIVVQHQDQYRDEDVDFEELIQQKLTQSDHGRENSALA